MSYTATEIRERSIEVMANNCMVCKNHDCRHANDEKQRQDWISSMTEYFHDEHFHCFEEKKKSGK
jgi:cbb3-type cytochrome oxidase cytochrome c subunit